MATKDFKQSYIDVGFLTETHLDGYHTSFHETYHIVSTHASCVKGGVERLFRDSPLLQIEEVKTSGKNAISCYLTSGNRRWRLIGLYLPPGDTEADIKEVESTLNDTDTGIMDKDSIVMGDLNYRMDGDHDRDIIVSSRLSSWGIQTSLVDHFRLKKRYHNKGTWRHPEGHLWVKCDYILISERKDWNGVRYLKPIPLLDQYPRFLWIIVG